MTTDQLPGGNRARATVHYLLAMVLFSIYGIQVCPFLESLTALQLLLPILMTFVLQWLCRQRLAGRIGQLALKDQVRRQFGIDLGLFIAGGIGLGGWNLLVYQFPLESAGKVIVGMLLLGFMIACDLALHREHMIARQLARSGRHMIPDDSPFPLSRKFSLFASVCALFVVGVVFLVINKDLEWLIHTGDSISLQSAQRYILTEILFIVSIIMAYVLLVIFGYARNLRFFLDSERRALNAVSSGDLAATVTVSSNDEFGLIARDTNRTIERLAARTEELNMTRDVSILALASLAETRDNETGAHIIRTQHYVRGLALALKDHPDYRGQLDEETVDLLFKSAPLHDVGKVGIPDAILLKPGKLTDEEFAIMKQHPVIGAKALEEAEQKMGSNSFLRLAREISLTHHEKWDGSGYPAGIAGEEIPLSGRLMAVADVYDALISERVYKPAFSHEKARDIILEGRGSHFDPRIVDAFVRCEELFRRIAREYSDRKAA